MSVRNTKRLIVFVIALLAFTSGLEVFLGLRRGHGVNYVEIAMPLFMMVAFTGTWQRLSKLEAEHGPDYVQPTPPHTRKVLIAVAALAAVLAGVAAYLIASRG